MYQQLEQYMQLLIDEKSAKSQRIAICCQNDAISIIGAQELAFIAQHILKQLDCSAVIVAEPCHPFPDFLLRRVSSNIPCLVPNDSESRTSLHDIPLIRQCGSKDELLALTCTALKKRKGCIVEGVGIISHSGLTIEQAYIAWSSLLHATTIKFFEDLLSIGPIFKEEHDFLLSYKTGFLKQLTITESSFNDEQADLPHEIIDKMILAGKATVQLGLVDSFFGNISYSTDNILYISQTSARLDQLGRQIDTIPFIGSLTTGITSSSELPAHQAIIKATNCKAILHGHPRFPVIISFFAVPGYYAGIDQVGEFPVVDGEGGTGGLADTLPRAFSLTGAKAVIVRGHGVFAISHSGLKEALSVLIEVEKRSRELYFSKLHKQHHI